MPKAMRILIAGEAHGEILELDEPLSFWGGFESETGTIIDQAHPQVGQSLVGKIVMMTVGRGSSSASSVLAEAIREARLTQAIEVVRLGARHRDRFVREASLRTLGALQDTGGLAVAVGRLDDPLPAIQRLALATLQQITGSHTLTTPDQWKAWCDKRACRGPRVIDQP